MFKISTRGDYGLLFMASLGEYYREGRSFVSLKKVAERKKLSLRYLSQIVVPLKEAGLVVSKEGREGGYALARGPGEITMMEVLEILEGPVASVKCCEEKTAGMCCSEGECTVKGTWQEAQKVMVDFLKSKTLADMLKDSAASRI